MEHSTLQPASCMVTHMSYVIAHCHLAEVTFPPFHQPVNAGAQCSDPGGMQGWVDLVSWLHTKLYTWPKTVTHPS